MRITAWRMAVPLLVAGAVACGRDSSRAAASRNAELQRDLAEASSSSLQLASGSQGYQRTQVVSAIERGEESTPVKRAPVPRPVPHRQTASAQPQQEKAPDPTPDVAVSAPISPEPEQPEVATTDAPTVPVVAPRPAPVPVDYPSSGTGRRGNDGAGGGIGTDIGTIIGIVIRGGVIGDDHCVPRTGGRPWPNGLPHPNPIPIRGPRRLPRLP